MVKFTFSMHAFFIIAISALTVHADYDKEIQEFLNKLEKSDYKKDVKPDGYHGKGTPIYVNCSMYILDVSSVDEHKMEFQAQFYFRQSWLDRRLSFRSSEKNPIVLHEPTHIWTPDLFFPNEKSGYQHNLVAPNTFVKISPDGTVFYSTRVDMTFGCPMDLHKYPFDKQRCYAYAESYGYTTKDLEVNWMQTAIGHPLGYSNDITAQGYKLENVTIDKEKVSLTTGEYARLAVELNFAHRSGGFVNRLYIPFIILVALSWVSFFISPRKIAPRMAVLLLILYLMVHVLSDMSYHFPTVPYTTALDVWCGVCIALVVLAVLEFLAAYIMTRRTVRDDNDPEAHSTIVNDTKVDKMKTHEANGVRLLASRLANDAFAIGRMDRLSRILFPGLFCAFNFVYWIVYCATD